MAAVDTTSPRPQPPGPERPGWSRLSRVSRAPFTVLDVPTRVRAGLLLLCLGLALLTGVLGSVAGWLVGLLCLASVQALLGRAGRVYAVGLVAETVAVCAGIVATGGSRSPLLPYVVAPMFSAGRRFGNRAVVALTAIGAVALSVGTALRSADPTDVTAGVTVLGWLALGLVSGLLAAWFGRLRSLADWDETAGYAQAQRLLSELRALAQRLPGSLDPATAAEGLLDRCWRITRHERAVVLTQYDGSHLVPVAVRGAERVPWRDPMSERGTLRTAWSERRTVLDERAPDDASGRRRGSSLLAIPLQAAEGSTLGLVAFESSRTGGFPPRTVQAFEKLIRQETPRIETALLFDDLRHAATLDERERLAKEMHNGVAQDLAYVGFALDDLRYRLADTAPEHAERVEELRNQLTGMMQDIRLSITDLRSSIGPERGLGTALSSYVRLAATAAGLTVHLSLRESYFRLPADEEVLLFRLTQTFVTHVRKTVDAQNLWVSLETDPPTATLQLEHDGMGADAGTQSWSDLAQASTAVEQAGGALSVTTPVAGRLRVEVKLTGGTPWRSDSSSSTTTS